MPTTTTAPTMDEILTAVKHKLGFMPNLFKEWSVSPASVLVYLHGQESLAQGLLTPQEQQAVQLTVSSVNGCRYCQAVHQTLGAKVGLTRDETRAIQDGKSPASSGVAGVVEATRLVMAKKGWLDAADLRTLEERGITKAKLYEIIAFIGLKTISNYINHIAHTTVDREFML